MAVLESWCRDRDTSLSRSLVAALYPLLILAVLPTVTAWAATFKPVQVKAAFIYSLTNFVHWPIKAAKEVDLPFVIAVLSDEEMARNLEIITRDDRIQGRKIVVRPYDTVDKIAHCRVLFIGAAAKTPIRDILKRFHAKNILIIGDTDHFTRQGGMVGLVQRGKRIHIEVNLEMATGAGIRLDSKLLKVADIVHTEN